MPGPFQVHQFLRNSSKSLFTKQESGREEILQGKGPDRRVRKMRGAEKMWELGWEISFY